MMEVGTEGEDKRFSGQADLSTRQAPFGGTEETREYLFGRPSNGQCDFPSYRCSPMHGSYP
jgi:hypothetical protein